MEQEIQKLTKEKTETTKKIEILQKDYLDLSESSEKTKKEFENERNSFQTRLDHIEFTTQEAQRESQKNAHTLQNDLEKLKQEKEETLKAQTQLETDYSLLKTKVILF